MKSCNKCKELKEYIFFNKDNKSPDKHSYSCKLCNRKLSADWEVKNKKRANERRKQYQIENKIKLNAYRKNRLVDKYNSDEIFRLITIARECARAAIRNQIIPVESKRRLFIGCDWDTFKAHIESQFQKGMSWENRNEWHIDHIIPLSRAQTIDDVYTLSNYKNTQPLWPNQNREKGNK